MNYTFHPHAEKELEQIEIYYDSELEGLGDRFRDEIQLTISRVLSKNVRRCRLNRFPYGIVYQVIPGKVFILAVMHDRREPYYWAYRT
jgi:hypothetical protein